VTKYTENSCFTGLGTGLSHLEAPETSQVPELTLSVGLASELSNTGLILAKCHIFREL